MKLRRGRLEAALQRPPAPAEIKADLASHPIPRNLDLRMHVIEEN
jgi:hypothetical protein